MKKRLRKKLRLGEFAETGFEITWTFQPDITETDCDGFLDGFLDMIAGKGLVFWGGCSMEGASEGIVARAKRYDRVDAADRETVAGWFQSRNEVKEFSAGEPIDLWYSADDAADGEQLEI
jgi:uncharacterized protein YggL (DUF469 family)